MAFGLQLYDFESKINNEPLIREVSNLLAIIKLNIELICWIARQN